MPLFTTIIPTYNRAPLLREALDSIFAQQNAAPPQVIVVDDGSTDQTMDLLASYAGRVEILQQTNRGPGAARNLGLSRAAGEYIAFLDSDDVWFPWTLATYRQVIEKHNRPAFVAGCPFRFAGHQHQTPGELPAIQALAFADYYASTDEWRWFGVSSFVIRRDVLVGAGGFTDDSINGEDADLTMKLGVAPGFVQIKSPMTFGYREHEGNVTRDAIKTYQGLRLLIDHEQAGRYPGGALRRAERRRILSLMARGGSVRLVGAGQMRKAWDVYRRAFAWNLAQGRFSYLLGLPLMALRGGKGGAR